MSQAAEVTYRIGGGTCRGLFLRLLWLVAISWAFSIAPPHSMAQGTDFSGTVLMVNAAEGKVTVKKEGGGTRFTFLVDDKTQFDGGLKGLKDLKKDDKVTVTYVVTGSQYIAQRVTKK